MRSLRPAPSALRIASSRCLETPQQQSCHIQAGDQRQYCGGADQHHEKHEESAVVALADSVRGQAGHWPEDGDATREILAPEITRGSQ